MLPTLKVYKIDWDFIISNYLDPSLWKKKWHLLIYKEHIFTIELSYIWCGERKVSFKVRCNNLGEYDYEIIEYTLDNTTIPVFKKQINGAIWKLMKRYEYNMIRKTQGYVQIKSLASDEEETLTDIAKNYLDENGVTNDDIRGVYIDNYVSKNKKTDVMLSNYMTAREYTLESEMFLTFASITNDNSRMNEVLMKCNNPVLVEQIEETVKEFKKEFEDTETYIESNVQLLEAI